MIRAFAAIPLPEAVTDVLDIVQEDLPAGRPVLSEDMHLTLVFLGDLREPDLEEVHLAFEAIRAGCFSLQIVGLGHFGGSAPRVVYAAVAENAPLRRLQSKLQQAARNTGVDLPSRRFVPHVTLARLKGRREDADVVSRFVATRSLIAPPPFAVGSFCLYRSVLRRDGPHYDLLADYKLLPSDASG
ncbi:RNA 2',3'-cyclic phosphodiesterase [Roseitranquillus sediminis]|uniref:RNA 2',3'-cyclic phosphodiesterase n=1 Tax=Roseitranquillus sediminis TaxID=2809051 RepID=UPI001D0CA03B|nr:RNA 2',3'-cyclic phosphodiesterase [Roseitranquillus sediminis]MBM9594208.1 RNA 2',3'-cyclic phosphodiesterase [Roseitranquillus sediminis]